MDSNEIVDDQQTDDQSQTDDQGAERTDWKAKAIELETKYKAEIGSRKRLEKDLRQFQEKVNTSTEKPADQQEKKGFDYGQKAYLVANGITDAEDQKWLADLVGDSKQELETVLGKQWVQAELKERKDIRMSEAATPPSGKRTAQSTRDTVDYWIAKGELPPADQPELRKQVVNAKIAAAKAKEIGGFGNAPEMIIK